MSAAHPALVLPPGLYEAAQFPVADGYLPIRVEALGAWAEYDPAEGEAYRVADPIAYFDNHGPMRPIDPREVPDL